MTSTTPSQFLQKPLNTMQKMAASWVVFTFVVACFCFLDTQNIYLHEGQRMVLARYAMLVTTISIAAGLAVIWWDEQRVASATFAQRAIGYVLAAVLCGFCGGSAALGGIPRASLLFMKTPMIIEAGVHKVVVDRGPLSRRSISITQWVWSFRHRNGATFDLVFDLNGSLFAPQRQISMNDGKNLPNGRRGLGGPTNARSVLLHGAGNAFAMRVFDFSVIDASTDT